MRREAFVFLLEPRQHAHYEAVVSLTTGSLLSWRLVPDARAPLMAAEYSACQALIRADAQIIAGVGRRRITDPAGVRVEPWSIGTFAAPEAADRRRVGTCLFHREP